MTPIKTNYAINTTNDAIAAVIDGLCFLILNHAQCAASEQWSPSRTPDDSDDYIRDHSEWVNKLRKIREDFEDLATGFIPQNDLCKQPLLDTKGDLHMPDGTVITRKALEDAQPWVNKNVAVGYPGKVATVAQQTGNSFLLSHPARI